MTPDPGAAPDERPCNDLHGDNRTRTPHYHATDPSPASTAQPGAPNDRQDQLGVGDAAVAQPGTGADEDPRLAAFRSFRCCGAPSLCGASCQDDEISALLAFANAEVDRLTAERDRYRDAWKTIGEDMARRLYQAAESYATDTRRLMAELDEARDAVDVLTQTVRDQAERVATAQAAMATAMAVQRVQTGQVEAVRGLMRAARRGAAASVPVDDLDRALAAPPAVEGCGCDNDPIECSHEAAVGELRERANRMRGEAEHWAGKAAEAIGERDRAEAALERVRLCLLMGGQDAASRAEYALRALDAPAQPASGTEEER